MKILPLTDTIVGAIDDAVHDGIGDGAVLAEICTGPDIPDICFILSAEDGGPAIETVLYNFQ